MKKLLLLFTLALVSIGSQASMPTPPGGDDFTWTKTVNGVDYFVSLTEQAKKQVDGQNLPQEDLLSVDNHPGSIAAWVAYLKSNDYKNNVNGDYNAEKPFMGLGQKNGYNPQNQIERALKITGTLNAADFAALSSLQCAGFSRYPVIDMSEVTLAEGTTANNVLAINFQYAKYEKKKPGQGNETEEVSGAGAEYIRLPNGVTDVAAIATLQPDGTGNTKKNGNLKVAGAYDATENGEVDKTHLAAYSFVSPGGHLEDFGKMFLYTTNNNYKYELIGTSPSNELAKLTLGGYITKEDLCNSDADLYSGAVFKSTVLHEFDFTECDFDENCTINVNPNDQNNKHVSDDSYGGTENTCTGLYEGASKKRVIDEDHLTVNALYFMRFYNPWTVTLSKNDHVIPPMTFNGNERTPSLQHLYIPDEATYTEIGFEAFYASDLEEIVLPGSLTYVGDGAFSNCQQLSDVSMEACLTTCEFGEKSFYFCQNVKHVTLSEGVQDISYMMFNQCAALEEIRIPNSCTHIDSYAFRLCTSLHSLTIPRSVRTMGQQVVTLSGVKDVYILAETPEEVPEIVPVPFTGDCPLGTFSVKDFGSNATDPRNGVREKQDLCHVGWEEGLTWYQEEMSGAAGLGLGNCMILLHYPDNMRDFYDSMGTPSEKAQWENVIANYNEPGISWDPDLIQFRIDQMESTADGHQWISDGYGFGSTKYDALHGTNKGNSDPELITGCDHQHSCSLTDCIEEGGVCSTECTKCEQIRRWPVQQDFVIRRAAGAVGGGLDANGDPVRTRIAWRQFPLMTGVGEEEKLIIPLEYDDTWYTMCFPWHLTDNQLFEAFNQKCEITEFVGVEMIDQTPNAAEGADKEYALVLHFDDVAKTYYVDSEDNFYHRDKIGTETIQYNGVTITKNKYKYTLLTGIPKDLAYADEISEMAASPLVEITDVAGYDETNHTDEQAEQHVKYLSIQNIIPIAGRPYMIHPSVGAAPGNPTTCNFVAVKEKTDAQWSTQNQKVTRTATTDDPYTPGGDGLNKTGIVPFLNPLTNGGGNYTFIGNVGKEAETDDVDAKGNKVMPTPAYFLAVEKTGTETVQVPVYVNQPVYEADGVTPVYVYTFVGSGGNVRYEFVPAHYEHVASGGNYVATTISPVAAGTGSYSLNTDHLVYVGNNSGSYNPVTFVENANNQGTYNCEPESRTYIGNNYVATDAYHVKQKVTKWQYTTDNTGEYSGTPEYCEYTNNGTHDVVAGSVKNVAGGAYIMAYRYIYQSGGTGGDYNVTFKQGGYTINDHYTYDSNTGGYIYSSEAYKQYQVDTPTPVEPGTGAYIREFDHYEYVGPGLGNLDVEFEKTGDSQQPYTHHNANLQYQSTTGYPYKAVEWEDDPNGQWLHTLENYSYVGSNGTHDPATFEQVSGGNYAIEQGYDEYLYTGPNTGNYEATAWTEANPAGSGDYNYIPAYDNYIDVTDGSGNYNKVQKTERVIDHYDSVTRDTYAKYPKYYRKKQTSGYKWTKYTAIIQPDADAIANIENYLNMTAASANGYNVSFGEWEEVTTTAIEEIVAEAEQRHEPVQKIHLNVVYNVKGQVVRNGSTSLEGLPKGLYIVNGKKYMVK